MPLMCHRRFLRERSNDPKKRRARPVQQALKHIDRDAQGLHVARRRAEENRKRQADAEPASRAGTRDREP